MSAAADETSETKPACLNCGTVLAGAYCHVCGQSAKAHHRSIWHLVWEGIEGFTHLDGRLAQTLVPLLFDPAKLARDHLEGRNARHVPSFRLFLITLLIFMFVLEVAVHDAVQHQGITLNSSGGHAHAIVHTPEPPKPVMPLAATKPPPAGHAKAAPDNVSSTDDWLSARIEHAAKDQDYYVMVLFTWGHRLAVLLLPVLASLLALAYVRQRQFYFYDHVIVAMQFLSFVFLIYAAAWIIPVPVRNWAFLAASLWTPVNLFMILRGTYGSGIFGAVTKTLFLWASTIIVSVALMAGLFFLTLQEIGG